MNRATRNGIILARYEVGASFGELAFRFGLSPNRVRRIVHRWAPELVRPALKRRGKPHDADRIDDIVTSAASGHPVERIAAACGVTPRAVRYVLDRYGPRHWRRRAA
jgi:hypothetical protein